MPIVNGVPVDLQPGPRPPGGGRWIQPDWTSDTFCPTPGFNRFRDAIIVGAPEEFVEAVDTIGAECHKACSVPEANDDVNVPGHSGAWTRTMQQGWSVGGSLSGEIEVTKAAKLAAGVEGAYSEAVDTGVTLNWAFPHCERDGFWRIYTQPVLRAEQRWLGKVYRYYLNARGTVMEGYARRDGQTIYSELVPFITFRGEVTIRRVYYKLGRQTHRDIACDRFEEVLPGTPPQRTRTSQAALPYDMRTWLLYSPDEVGRMFGEMAHATQLSDLARQALYAVLTGDTVLEASLRESIQAPKPGELVRDTDPFEWILANASLIRAFPDAHRNACLKVLGAA